MIGTLIRKANQSLRTLIISTLFEVNLLIYVANRSRFGCDLQARTPQLGRDQLIQFRAKMRTELPMGNPGCG